MAERIITIIIDENGQITASTNGFKGESCLSELEELLSTGDWQSVKKTDEYYQTEKLTNKKTIQNKQS